MRRFGPVGGEFRRMLPDVAKRFSRGCYQRPWFDCAGETKKASVVEDPHYQLDIRISHPFQRDASWHAGSRENGPRGVSKRVDTDDPAVGITPWYTDMRAIGVELLDKAVITTTWSSHLDFFNLVAKLLVRAVSVEP